MNKAMMYPDRQHQDLVGNGIKYRLDGMYEFTLPNGLLLLMFWECDEEEHATWCYNEE